MTLADYLNQKEITPAEFAVLVGVRPLAVYRWMKGERTPRPQYQRKIHELTGGRVTPNDFHDMGDNCGEAA